jgi:hypothetical protein
MISNRSAHINIISGAVGIVVGAAVGLTIHGTETNKLQNSIDNYVAANGNGSINCHFVDAGDITFANKKLSQIDQTLQPLVIKGLETGACWGELPKLPNAARPDSRPANSLQLQPKNG